MSIKCLNFQKSQGKGIVEGTSRGIRELQDEILTKYQRIIMEFCDSSHENRKLLFLHACFNHLIDRKVNLYNATAMQSFKIARLQL